MIQRCGKRKSSAGKRTSDLARPVVVARASRRSSARTRPASPRTRAQSSRSWRWVTAIAGSYQSRPAAARDGEREDRVLAGVRLGEPDRSDRVAPVHDRHRRDVGLRGPGCPRGDPLRVVQVVVELAVAARAAVDDPAADADDRGVASKARRARASQSGARPRRRRGMRAASPSVASIPALRAPPALRRRRVADDPGAGLPRRLGRAVGRGVVHDDAPRAAARSGRGPTTASATVRFGVAAGDDDAGAHETVSLAAGPRGRLEQDPVAEETADPGQPPEGPSRSSALPETARGVASASDPPALDSSMSRRISCGRRTAMCSGNCFSRKSRALSRST